MKIHRLTIIVIIFCGLINLNLQCDKQDVLPPDYQYTFIEKFSISPYQLDYNVGDTLWLDFNVPGKKLFDQKTNGRIFYDSASFVISISVDLIFNDPFIAYPENARFVYEPGVSVTSQNYAEFTSQSITTGCSSSSDYKLHVGVILTRPGVFGVSVYAGTVQNCYTHYATPSELRVTLDIGDPHKAFYQSLPFINVGKIQDNSVLQNLDAKRTAIINVH
ncbi:MAG: hypothetical protein ABIR81_04280 [Ginsengibacter sp.]